MYGLLLLQTGQSHDSHMILTCVHTHVLLAVALVAAGTAQHDVQSEVADVRESIEGLSLGNLVPQSHQL